ncbi:MAG: aldo/keto reductase [Fervidicoccaceae archaeon]
MNIGKSGIKASVIGLGFWQLGSKLWGKGGNNKERALKIIQRAAELGINLFDTAEIYGMGESERVLGYAIRNLSLKESAIIVSKIAGFRVERKDIEKSIKMINSRIGREVDIILHHWPPDRGKICNVVQALEQIVKEGKAHYYGLSNYGDEALRFVLSCTKSLEPVADELQYSLGYRTIERGTMELLKKNNISLIAWSPLAKGALAGATAKSIVQRADPVFNEIKKEAVLNEVLENLARKRGVTRAAISLLWIVSKGGIPIPGTMNERRVEEYAAAGEIELSADEIEALDRASSKFVNLWGNNYLQPRPIVSLPKALQALLVNLMRGI